MYIHRAIDSHLEDWKNDERRKPLLVRGARQVGKSSAVRHLGTKFDHFLEVNFEKRPEVKGLFANIHDVHELASTLGALYNTPVVAGRTLLFLDEIQSCPEAIKSLWFFKEEYPELHVVAAGSLLEFALKDLPSFGVGRIRSLFMYPFSFDEFIAALGKDQWVQSKRSADSDHPLHATLHQELVRAYRTFLLVGGMPASVSAWVETHDYTRCQDELDDIQLSYRDDFAKYARKVQPELLRNTLNSVVQQTGVKFVFSKVEGAYKTDEVKRALSMLCDAGLVFRVSHTAGNGLPLGAEVNDKFRKYIFLDSGLLLRILDLDFGGAQALTEQILTATAEDLVNKGGLAEMVLGLEMMKYASPRAQRELFYWENTAKGATAEVDYLIAKDMHLIPVECKAGTSGKMKSLRLFMRNKRITEAYRCSLENFSQITFSEDGTDESQIHINPLYAVSNLMQ